MNVAVCVPWSDVGCEWRRRAKDYTHEHWDALGVTVVCGNSSTLVLNRSADRNAAAALLRSTDVLFFADADTWVSSVQFWAAVERAHETNQLIQAYTKLIRLHRKPTEQFYGDGVLRPLGQVVFRQPLGCVAVSRKLFDTVGGFDERFLGWGGEDRAFQFACDTLAGVGERIKGDAFHLWHPRSPEQGRRTPQGTRNLALAARYKMAAGVVGSTGPLGRSRGAKADPVAMLSILREPGGPLHDTSVLGTDEA